MNPVATGGVVAWRCFHCDDEFTDRESAALHFGRSLMHEPACTIDVAEYRRMEAECESYREEDAVIHREMRRMASEHRTALQRAEEDGYAKGLGDYQACEDKLTAAQAEADRLRVDALSEVMNIACRELPEGYEVRLCAERGAGWVALFDHDGDEVEFDQDDLTLPERVRASIKAAKNEQGSGNV